MTKTIHTQPAATAARTELRVAGMTCNNCARHVTEAIQGVAGVHSAVVNLEAGQASVRWGPGAEPDVPALVGAVEKRGFTASVMDPGAAAHDNTVGKLSVWQFTLGIGILGTAPLMIGEWILGLGLTPWFQWVSFGLATLVQVFAGAQFYRGAWSQIKVGGSNMDTLVALGSTTAFAYSTWALLSGRGGHVYFMEAAAIITLISLGHWMESRVSRRASSALRQLLNLAPQTARRLERPSAPQRDAFSLNPPGRETGFPTPFGGLPSLKSFSFSSVPAAAQPAAEGIEIEVPVARLNIGDLVVLRPGDRIPTDGEVVSGDSAVDEAMLTGESAPVDKSEKSLVYGGTVNLNGSLAMRVTATGEATALSHIIAAVQRAQSSRAHIQRLGDRVSSVFVPVVVGIAIASALWWGLAPDSARQVHAWLGQFLWPAHPPAGMLAAAFMIAASVLIIACPCAMGLATPAAIMAGSNAAAARGILIRDGVALEKAGEVTAVLFDKTGTLTSGKPEVVRVWESEAAAPAPRPALAAALARHSSHPISLAVAKISSEPMRVTDWREVRGLGVECRVASSSASGPVRLGSLNWLRELGVDLSAGGAFIAEWTGQGATVVGLSLGDALLALLAVKDTVKAGTARVIAELQRQGLKTYLVTGDHALTAAGIAGQAGIPAEHVFAGVRPEQKAAFVKALQQQGERVAFVGDGINDAPALEQADLGIAVSRASDVAREAADIILLNSEIEAVPEALGLARATLRTIKQNLFWAFFYNAVGIPLAALGFMSPILCATAMGFSDLIVIGNALRLRRWKLRGAGLR